MPKRKRKPMQIDYTREDWVDKLLDKGIGAMAIGFLAKLKQGQGEIKVCPYCDIKIKKWSRTCPNCRNTLYL